MINLTVIIWLKKNWQTALVIILAIILVRDQLFPYSSIVSTRSNIGLKSLSSSARISTGFMEDSIMPVPNRTPPSDTSNRLIITDSSLSLLVEDVSVTINQINQITNDLGGFLVNSNLSKPQSAASGTITIRVPQDKLPQAMTALKGLSVKVVSESVSGRDVTDQFVDLEARLAVLTKTKAKYEQILDQATAVRDILDVQRELTNLQSKIDSLKGRQKYLEQSAKLSKITAYLSTDELSLPYTPDSSWRPKVIFKNATRSLIGNIRNLGNLIIWSAVYLPLIIPLYFIFRFIKKRKTIQS